MSNEITPKFMPEGDAAPDLRFLDALKRLEEDKQPVQLMVSKIDLWMLCSAVQLACRHPRAKTSSSLQRAENIARQLLVTITAQEPELRLLAEMGWQKAFDGKAIKPM